MAWIGEKGKFIDVAHGRGLEIVVAAQARIASGGPFGCGIPLASSLVRPQEVDEELVALRFDSSRAPDVEIGVGCGERELSVGVTRQVVPKDQAEANCFEAWDVCKLLLHVRDRQVDVEDWLGDEPGNRGRANVVNRKRFGTECPLDQGTDKAEISSPAGLVLVERLGRDLPMSDPLTLPINVGRWLIWLPERMGDHDATLPRPERVAMGCPASPSATAQLLITTTASDHLWADRKVEARFAGRSDLGWDPLSLGQVPWARTRRNSRSNHAPCNRCW